MMYGRWTRVWMISLLLATPGVAGAQTAPEAGQTEVAPAEPPAEAPAETKPEEDPPAELSEEAKAAEEKAKAEAEAKAAEEKAKAEAEAKAQAEAELQKQAEEAKAAVEASKAEAAKATESKPDAPAATDSKADPKAPAGKDGKKVDATQARLGAAAPVPADLGRPWQIFGTFDQSLGLGAFVKDGDARQVAYAYQLIAQGTYKIGALGDGRLDAFGDIRVSQQLTDSFNYVGTSRRQLLWNDLRLGLLGRGLLREETTGAIVGGNFNIDLPTGWQSRASDRLLRLNASSNVARSFAVGPGNLLARVIVSARKDFGPSQADGNPRRLCEQARGSPLEGDTIVGCGVGATVNWGASMGVSGLYLLGNLSFSASVFMNWIKPWDLGDSGFTGTRADPNLGSEQIGVGLNGDNAPLLAQWTTGFEIGYQVMDNISLGLGLSSLLPTYDTRNRYRFPLFDTQSWADNWSSLYFDVNFIY